MKIVIFCGMLGGFVLLFRSMAEGRLWYRIYGRAKESLEQATRERSLRSRRELRTAVEDKNLWRRLEQLLDYSGIALRFPGFTPEIWCFANVLVLAGMLPIGLTSGKIALGIGGYGIFLGIQWLVVELLCRHNLRVVHEELPKLLDFLGNYSITAGEISGIFQQVSRYLREPLGTLLERCSLEAATTGDVSMALMVLARKIEHPKCKELIRNMEIGIHYCADMGALVRNSRRTIREYQQLREERRGMLREAVINILLLLAMSVFVLLTVDRLLQDSIWRILLRTLPGNVALAVVGIILLVFVRQLRDANG